MMMESYSDLTGELKAVSEKIASVTESRISEALAIVCDGGV